MRLGSRSMGVLVGAAAATFVCLAGAAVAAGQAGPAQDAPQRPPMAEDVFKSVTILKGIPVDTFFDAMGMFANSMGNDCTFCHVKEAAFDRAQFATPTARIARARQMITMMNSINQSFFGGRRRVTCFTCHGGAQSPASEPNIALQYSAPLEDPNVLDFEADAKVTADQLFDKYIQALGGKDRLAGVSSFVATGTYAGFDTALAEVPVQLFAKNPNQRAMVVRTDGGESVRIFDGRNGWIAGPETPLPLVQLTAGNLDRARLEAMLAFPAGIRQAYSKWKVGRSVVDDREVYIVQGTDSGPGLTNFYFDPSGGLLVRLVRWTDTPVGRVPTQIDYSDYRPVAGVQMPFRWTVTQTYLQGKVALTDIKPNVSIDAARFSKPAPASRSK